MMQNEGPNGHTKKGIYLSLHFDTCNNAGVSMYTPIFASSKSKRFFMFTFQLTKSTGKSSNPLIPVQTIDKPEMTRNETETSYGSTGNNYSEIAGSKPEMIFQPEIGNYPTI